MKILEEYEKYSRINEEYKEFKIVREYWNFGENLKIFQK
jgi:hypothetical protein